MRIVADDAIPYVRTLFEQYAQITLIPGHEINLRAIKDADALIVRSTLAIDASLLAGSRVKFVGTATSGVEHVDREYLKRSGIHFADASGANSESVVEYILAAISEFAVCANAELKDRTVGIVGCGSIGSELASRCGALGIGVQLCDPPLQAECEQRGKSHPFCCLSSLLQSSDVISVSVPKSDKGPNATTGLIGNHQFAQMAKDSWLINTSRGGIVNESALCSALLRGPVSYAAVDVWAGEPDPNQDLIDLVSIATPHIAGYSIDAKRRSTKLILLQFIEYFSLDYEHSEAHTGAGEGDMCLVPPETCPEVQPTLYITQIIRQMYDIRQDDLRLRALSAVPGSERECGFRDLRKEYPVRFRYGRFHLDDPRLKRTDARRLAKGLEIRVAQAV